MVGVDFASAPATCLLITLSVNILAKPDPVLWLRREGKVAQLIRAKGYAAMLVSRLTGSPI